MVRIPLDNPSLPAGSAPSEYVDVEVLDAISFRIENNKEVIFDLSNRSVPWIVDNTGGGHDKQPDDPTQLTHMVRLTNPSDSAQQLDVEVLDCWAARDQNGEEWVLDMQPQSPFDVTDGSGAAGATRRTHDEIIADPSGTTKASAGTSYLTSQRNDDIAFRKLLGQEVIVCTPSCDDPNSPNISFGRASTYITPQGYDPSDDSDSAVVPPLLAASGDQHNFVNPVSGAAGFLTGDAKIKMGPFWWIRKAKSGYDYLRIDIVATDTTQPVITFDVGDLKKPHATLLDHILTVRTIGGTDQLIYFPWCDIAPFPTLTDYNYRIISGYTIPYYGQFASVLSPFANQFFLDNGFNAFGSLADAEAYATAFNATINPPNNNGITGYFLPNPPDNPLFNLSIDVGGVGSLYAAELDISTGVSYVTVAASYLFKIPTGSSTITFTVAPTPSPIGSASSSLLATGYSDVKKTPKKVSDAGVIGFNPFPPAITPDTAFVAPNVPSGFSPDIPTAEAFIQAGAIYKVVTKEIAGPNPTEKAHHVQLAATLQS